ncbi:hypothetical protein F4820DRAFT_458345 [Hypoxylon rubiginosum]|uniref:Uncharacterized protein n=1 Tax=Hypoxylon rubiginosum TaxID=110542 RepID=A0ACB9Z1C5_9PEZI|nr:hypothetical protein F4820DRAFT_458345 [Hypoxylon rubiginosum]
MDPATQPEQSAELPIMPDGVVKLVRMLDGGESLEKIGHALVESDLVAGIADNGFLEGDELRLLLHSMSRKMLRSVLLKTLGPDLYNPDFSSKENWEHVLKGDGPGAYVVFIFIRQRQGRFLSVKEIRELIELLEQYAAAVDAYQSHKERDQYGTSQFTDEEMAAMLVAMKIDDTERTYEKNDLDNPDFEEFRPRFGSKTKENMIQKGRNVKISDNINDFIKMLEKRCLPNVDEEVYQMQSPMMVGNAGNIAKRVQDHMPGTSLNNTAKLWGLLLSCLSMMDLEYEVRSATLFSAWEDAEQVNHAEILGTVLAGSMLSMDGCNAKQPGTRGAEGRTEPYGYENSKDHVFAGRPWFIENLKHSLASRGDPEEERQLQEDMAEMEQNAVELRDLGDKVEKAKERLERANVEFDNVMAQTQANLQESQAFVARLEEIVENEALPT